VGEQPDGALDRVRGAELRQAFTARR
jgi:hypothetical protein